jgi:hypothetical protein
MKRFFGYLPVAMMLFLAACSKGEDNASQLSEQPEQWDAVDPVDFCAPPYD